MTFDEAVKKYQVTIGIECHVQLKTATKLFSGASNDAREADPNTTVSPICFGFPGVLPVLNRSAVELAVLAGLALNSEIAEVSRFERKHYFYPDLPKGYQITQLEEPIVLGGYVEAPMPNGEAVRVRLHHAHMEEDAGKLTHPAGKDYSLVDLNRAGTPLIEIVSEADMHSPAEARAYAEELHRLMTFAGVTDGDMYHGNMRFDVNLSLSPVSSERLGTRTETKNLNSFKSVERAAEYEVIRQAELLDKGERVVQETRGWDEARGRTVSQRSKEDAHDYRYMPEPDIPPLVVDSSQIKELKARLPKLPADYRTAWNQVKLNPSVINALLTSQAMAEVVEAVRSKQPTATSKVANWFASGLDESTVVDYAKMDTDELVALAELTNSGQLSSTGAKQIFNQLVSQGGRAEAIAKTNNLIQVSDETALGAIVDEVLADPACKQAIDDLKAGQDKAIGFLVGQSMKRSKGSGNPQIFQGLIRQKLGL
ncbi:MAG TPA: Asp-tRNA(Asn)/Glu-tRNA(Gln) amidotransferase subunit GatB [Candidatus Saccharimonadales bacterium]|nr:Asp-tRNA(Asn)/Glu-tRNA(Gln) amidotransferase subunit GatB [Candidatus Saccharimonadales bacterium]